ncbi:MAG: hypothetical protein SGILL_007398 [Bacillariaceae sp.]
MMEPERIYIGGLDPARLCASDILRRLKAIDRIKISSSAATEDTKPYLHVEAISGDPGHSALEIIAKQYHNVKWKGCKLVVEAARPHFMERLAEERKQHVMPDCEGDCLEDENASSIADVGREPKEIEMVSNLPRRLRVRKKFGEEAFHIDTKPWTSVESTLNDNVLDDAEEQESLQGSASANSDDVSASLSSESKAVQQTKLVNTEEKSYEWSESEGDDDDDDDDTCAEGTIAEGGPGTDIHFSNRSDTHDLKTGFSDHDSRSFQPTRSVGGDQDESGGTQKTWKRDKYLWSSDEELSDEETPYYTVHEKNKEFLKCIEYSGADEFAAGLDGDEGRVEEDMEEYDSTESATQQSSNLKDDVASNLDILSSIFPDMNAVRPASVEVIQATGSIPGKEPCGENIIQQQPTIIPRYDPSMQSSQKHSGLENAGGDANEMVHKDCQSSVDEASNGTNLEDSKDGLSDCEGKGLVDKFIAASLQETVYEQDKLESVFRDARDAWEQKPSHASTFTLSTATEEQPSGVFTFGFALGDSSSTKAPPTTVEETSGFSFSFDLASNPSSARGADASEESVRNLLPARAETGDAIDTLRDRQATDVVRPRRRGLAFPEEDLSRYVGYFVSFDDGQYTHHDKEEWIRERHSLTLDWKRKRKYAMSRIQKRLKTR